MLPNHIITELSTARTRAYINHRGRGVAKTAWGNNTILFLQPPPEEIREHHGARERPTWDTLTFPGEMPTLWPVEIRYDDWTGYTCVRFSDGNGSTYWLDAGLVSAALKNAKRQAPQITWCLCLAQTTETEVAAVAAVLLDRPQVLIPFLDHDRFKFQLPPEWQLLNDHIPTPFNPEPPKYIDPETVTQATLL